MYEFKYHRPNSVRQAANMLAKDSDAKILAGGHSLLPAMKLRLAKHDATSRHRPHRRPVQHRAQGPLDRDRRHGAPCRGCDLPIVKEALPALAELAGMIGDPAVRHRGTIGGSLANNDPNCRLSGGGARPWRHHHHQQAADRRRRFLQGHVRNRARARRDHHQGELPAGQEGGLPEVQAPGLGLRAGRRVREQARLRHPRGGHRRRRERRVPRARASRRRSRSALPRSRSRA